MTPSYITRLFCISRKCKNEVFRPGLKHCYRHIALTVECPKCHAPINVLCKTHSGSPYHGSHSKRVALALKRSKHDYHEAKAQAV